MCQYMGRHEAHNEQAMFDQYTIPPATHAMVPGVPCGDHGNWDQESLRMFSEESLGKIKFRAFPKRVGPRNSIA